MKFEPIQTSYQGVLFRSRLEARYAVMLDHLGIKWEYEPESYAISTGEPYLPDFFLPGFDGPSGMFVEVKREGGCLNKPWQFVRDYGVAVWLAVGFPDIKVWDVIVPVHPHDAETMAAVPMADQAYCEYRMFWEPGYEQEDGSIAKCDHEMLGDLFIDAVSAARTARFGIYEHTS